MSTTPLSTRSRISGKARIITALVLVIAVVGLVFGLHYWFVSRFFESTDDAYLQADNTIISAQVSGTLTELLVKENQRVHKGDVLLRIDQREYQARVAQSEANISSAQAALDNVQAQIDRQQAAVTQAEATSRFSTEDAQRYAKLVAQGAASQQLAQKSRSESESNQAMLETERKQLDVLKTEKEKAQADLEHAKAALELDKINLGYAEVAAPIDGVIADRAVEQGESLTVGMRLMTIVPVQEVYLEANFKETQIEHMHRGSKVTVEVDAFPDMTFDAHIDSLAPGTGAQFALLPPENATGNFTKIVQRVPVKIMFEPNQKHLDELRPGLSVTVRVDTRTGDNQPVTKAPEAAIKPAAGQNKHE